MAAETYASSLPNFERWALLQLVSAGVPGVAAILRGVTTAELVRRARTRFMLLGVINGAAVTGLITVPSMFGG